MKCGSRRSVLFAVVGLILSSALVACESGSTSGHSKVSTEQGQGHYPYTIETLYGDVVINEEPKRVVALTVPTADELLSLGVTPLAVAQDPAELDTTAPWLAVELAPISKAGLISAGDVQLEAIAALEPDLIISTNFYVQDREVFDRLNEIAPTIAPRASGTNVDWDERLLYTAKAVNATSMAEEIVASIQDEWRTVGDTIGTPSDLSYNFVSFNGEQFSFGNGSVFELLGIAPAPNQVNDQSGEAVSRENTAQLNADLLAVWLVNEDRSPLDADPLFQQLPAVMSGSIIYADYAMAVAINGSAPHALKWLLEQIKPALLTLSHE